jgi:thioredoxin reductase (NADPH)
MAMMNDADLSETRPLVVAIDDDPAVLAALSRLLNREPYEFVALSDPEKALELIHARAVALVLADYRMPLLSGTGFLQAVKSASPTTIRVMLTAYPQSGWVVRAREMELMDLVLEKPWSNDELRKIIREKIEDRKSRIREC